MQILFITVIGFFVSSASANPAQPQAFGSAPVAPAPAPQQIQVQTRPLQWPRESAPAPSQFGAAGVQGEAAEEVESVIKCTHERECRAACGSRASDFQCSVDTGSCLCLNENGPPRRCRNVKHQEEACTDECKRRISQICYTDFGKLCSCFVRN